MVTPPLYVEKSGNPDGPTLIFLHAIGTSGWMWQNQVKRLSQFNCVVPDLPGHGKSNHIPWQSFAETAQLVIDLIQTHAKSEKANMVGLSLGAYVGLQLLSDSPSVVERAVLSGVHILPMPNRRLMIMMSYLMMPFMRSGWIAHLNADALHIPPEKFDGYHRSFRQMSRQAFLKASRDAVNFEMPENISSIAVPTLIAAGEKEQALIHQSQKALVKMTPQIEAYVAPNVGHGWSLEAPQLFADMIQAWTHAQPLPDQLQLVV